MNTMSRLTNDDIRFRNSIDGLLDIGIGSAFLLAGLAFLLDMVAVTGGFFFVIFLLIVGLKKKVVYPRIGYVEHKGMSAKTQKLILLLVIVGFVFFVLGAIVFMLVSNGQHKETIDSIIRNYGAIVIGLVISLIIFLVGRIFKVVRFYLYSILVFGAFLAIRFINYDSIIPASFFVCGGVILSIGVVMFISFINKYPKLDGSEGVENE